MGTDTGPLRHPMEPHLVDPQFHTRMPDHLGIWDYVVVVIYFLIIIVTGIIVSTLLSIIFVRIHYTYN